MMLGVLVIAFPVSIFSELWRDELRDIGVLKSIDGSQASMHEDDGHLDESEILPKFIRADLNNDSVIPKNLLQESIRSTNESSLRADAISSNDIRAIQCYINVIDEAQKNMKQLLKNIESSST
jgi:hypothetical protein